MPKQHRPRLNHNRRRLLALFGSGLLAACGAPLPTPTPTTVPTPSTAPTPSDPPIIPPTPASSPTPAPIEFSAPALAEPLMPLTITIQAPGHNGPAELNITDAQGRLSRHVMLTLNDGNGQIEILPRGALGPQRAELVINGRMIASTDQLFILRAETVVTTGQARFDEIYPRLRNFMQQGRLSYMLDDQRVSGYRSPDNPLLWLRDHTYQARGFRYFEHDLTSLIDGFRNAQNPNGSLPDWLANRNMGILKPGRKEVEADVEFLFVQAVMEAWQATGDDTWLQMNLNAMRQALDYSMSDPQRWDAERGLVKRPYTIDMWDFSYGPTTLDPSNGKPAPRHWIDDKTIWGIFHGDNTGVAHALNLLALAEDHVGDPQEAVRRRAQADALKDRLNEVSWNGRFFTHFVPLTPFEPAGVDPAAQLSLSNTIALNREVLRSKQGRAIVEEYFERGAQRDPTVFAEWYSIDPPFPAGSYGLGGRPGEKPGEYVNGGIMPLVGGELARGAFNHGAERYAFEILHRYYFLISTTSATYLWYYPVGSPGISGVDTLPTDGWGASAMLAALIEGAAGIEDRGVRYNHTRLSPRWAATADVRNVRAVASYAASDGYAAYRWEQGQQSIRLEYTGSGTQVELRILLPETVSSVAHITLDDTPATYEIRDFFGSRYVILEAKTGSGVLEVDW
ncbi:MAG: hypothetical protein SH847_06065 [Roseiflexaceae bacterium]|nr:hypothetical protein [Roseiflexaceae bacterium]